MPDTLQPNAVDGAPENSGADQQVMPGAAPALGSNGGNPEKVDFIQTQSDDFQVETMPQSSGSGKRGGKKVLVILLIVLGVGAIAALAAAGWIYRDALGFGGSAKVDSDSVSENTTSSAEITSLNDDLKSLELKVTQVEEKIADQGSADSDTEYVMKDEHEKQIEKIEKYLSFADTDEDGLSDYEEVTKYETNPAVADTDGDGFSDGDEVEAGYNPNGEGKLIVADEETSTKSDSEASESEKDKTSESDEETSTSSKYDGSYIGIFALTDVEVSSNDVKLTISNDSKISGSYTFEYQGTAYSAELSGTLEESTEDSSFLMSLDVDLISGSEKETHSTEMFLDYSEESKEFTGVIQFADSDKNFLDGQKGQVSFKKSTLSFLDSSTVDKTEDADSSANSSDDSEDTSDDSTSAEEITSTRSFPLSN